MNGFFFSSIPNFKDNDTFVKLQIINFFVHYDNSGGITYAIVVENYGVLTVNHYDAIDHQVINIIQKLAHPYVSGLVVNKVTPTPAQSNTFYFGVLINSPEVNEFYVEFLIINGKLFYNRVYLSKLKSEKKILQIQNNTLTLYSISDKKVYVIRSDINNKIDSLLYTYNITDDKQLGYYYTFPELIYGFTCIFNKAGNYTLTFTRSYSSLLEPEYTTLKANFIINESSSSAWIIILIILLVLLLLGGGFAVAKCIRNKKQNQTNDVGYGQIQNQGNVNL